MSRDKKIPLAGPSLEQLLGTSLRSEQIARVGRLIEMAQTADLFLLVTFNPLTGKAQVNHTAGLSEEAYKNALEIGHQYLHDQQAKARASKASTLEAQGAAADADPVVDSDSMLDAIIEPVVGANGQAELPPEPVEKLPASYEQGEGLDGNALVNGAGG